MPVPADLPITHVPLRPGSVLTLRRAAPRRGGEEAQEPPLVDLTQIAGPGCGLAVGLGPGEFVVGHGGDAGLQRGRVARPMVRIEVSAAGQCRVSALWEGEVRVDGRTVAAGAAQDLDWSDPAHLSHAGSVVAAGDAVFRLAPALPDGSGDPTIDANDNAPRPTAAPGTAAAIRAGGCR